MWADPVFTMSPTEKTKNSNSTSTEGDNSSPAGNVIELVGSKILRLEPDNLKELISDLKLSIAEDPDYSKNKPTLAIAAFKLISRTGEELSPSNADNIREDLSTGLIKSKSFDIVERGQLEKALTELKIGLKDTFDSTTAQKLGRLVNARTVLIGSISDRGTFIVINVRLIDTQTGKSHIASQTKIQQ